MLKKLLLISFMFCRLVVYSQKEADIWYFGEKAGIDFSGGNPVALMNSSMNTPEGCASICDQEGALLFYTNGVSIWNRNHEVMDNGINLNGNNSSTQSSIIVPHPGNDSLYYVFCIDNHAGAKGASYSIVNIELNNGLGKVITKNAQLTGIVTEKISAVLHCNNKDVWLTVRLWNSPLFYSFLIDKNGLNTDPVISTTSNNLTGHVWGTLGSMKISPNGKRIAAAHGWSINYIEIGNYDRKTGQVTNIDKLSVSPPGFNGFETGPYGIEFSPDSRYLYVYSAYGTGKSEIYQFDLNNATIAAIQSSRQLVADLDYPYAGSLQLGPDQKIYVANSFESSLSVINQPNSPFPLCNFQFGQVQLGRRCALGLPNFIQSFVDPNYSSGTFSALNCSSRNLNFQINRLVDISSARWYFGDPASGPNNFSTLLSPSHVYPTDGFYTVTLIINRSCIIDTIQKRVYAGSLILNLNAVTNGCFGDSLLLSVPFYSGVKYKWSNGTSTNATKVGSPGRYWVTATAGCMFSDTTDVSLFNKPVFDLGPDVTICSGDQVILDPKINAASYQWSNGATSTTIVVNQVGPYWLRATNSSNCSYSDTVMIKDKPFPLVILGNDTLICETEQLVLNPRIHQSGLSYRWQDGSSSATFKVNKSGIYILHAQDNCTSKSDTIEVTFKTCPMGIPNAFSPNGDGKNDFFRAKYGMGVSQFRMLIFNRFGQLVFDSPDQLRGWDGNLNGKALPTGTYAWMVRYKETGTGKTVQLKGTVTLIR